MREGVGMKERLKSSNWMASLLRGVGGKVCGKGGAEDRCAGRGIN